MQMKMKEKIKKFDKRNVQKLLEEENKYITDILTTFNVPDSIEDEELDKMYLLDNSTSDSKLPPSATNLKKITNRGQEEKELENRMEVIKNKLKSKKSDKIRNKQIKKKKKKENLLKKKLISVQKALKNEKIKEEKSEEQKEVNQIQTNSKTFNPEGKIVFSKFDFASHPGAKIKKTKKEKVMKNPKDILKKLKDQKQKISELIEKGEKEKAHELNQNLAWKRVFDKTEGKKVKDDPNLLQKALKKRKDQKMKSKQKWKERKEKVAQGIAQRQKKRQENINKKLKDKKVSKLKRLSKKGRVIPGF